MILLDTSACIELMSGERPPEETRGESFALSTLVEMELWAGVEFLRHRDAAAAEREVYRIHSLIEVVQVDPFDSDAAQAASRVLADLEKRGARIGDIDSMIAGHALARQTPLLSCNPDHFRRVSNLQLIPWHPVRKTRRRRRP